MLGISMKILVFILLSILLSSCSKKEDSSSNTTTTNIETSNKSAKLTQITSQEQFNTLIAKKDHLAIIDLYADWCGPCRIIAPIFSELSEEFGNRADFIKVDVDKHGQISNKYKARSIPLVVFVKNGKEVDRLVGARSKKEYQKLIEKHL